jgi:hypothetical protein
MPSFLRQPRFTDIGFLRPRPLVPRSVGRWALRVVGDPFSSTSSSSGSTEVNGPCAAGFSRVLLSTRYRRPRVAGVDDTPARPCGNSGHNTWYALSALGSLGMARYVYRCSVRDREVSFAPTSVDELLPHAAMDCRTLGTGTRFERLERRGFRVLQAVGEMISLGLALALLQVVRWRMFWYVAPNSPSAFRVLQTLRLGTRNDVLQASHLPASPASDVDGLSWRSLCRRIGTADVIFLLQEDTPLGVRSRCWPLRVDHERDGVPWSACVDHADCMF